LLLTTIILEGYLVQRSFQVNTNLQEKIVDLDNPNSDDAVRLGQVVGTQMTQTQQVPMGFKINYGTLSILWPIVLFAFFVAVRILLNKRVDILKELKAESPDFKLSNLRLDLFSLVFTKKRDQTIFVVLIFYLLPIIGLLFHAYSGYYMVDLIQSSTKTAQIEVDPEDQKLVNQLIALFITQVVISTTFLVFVLFINRKSNSNYKISANMLLSKS
jgi:hypothetical protein